MDARVVYRLTSVRYLQRAAFPRASAAPDLAQAGLSAAPLETPSTQRDAIDAPHY